VGLQQRRGVVEHLGLGIAFERLGVRRHHVDEAHGHRLAIADLRCVLLHQLHHLVEGSDGARHVIVRLLDVAEDVVRDVRVAVVVVHNQRALGEQLRGVQRPGVVRVHGAVEQRRCGPAAIRFGVFHALRHGGLDDVERRVRGSQQVDLRLGARRKAHGSAGHDFLAVRQRRQIHQRLAVHVAARHGVVDLVPVLRERLHGALQVLHLVFGLADQFGLDDGARRVLDGARTVLVDLTLGSLRGGRAGKHGKRRPERQVAGVWHA
jgi:hypothetical protein